MNGSPFADTDFIAAVDNLLNWEGGFVDDPADPGGATNFGITRRSYPALDIAALTRDDAEAIYWRDWWQVYRLGDLPPQIGGKMLEFGVNVGMTPATRCLQRALCHVGVNVEVDGQLGPLTRAACSHSQPAALLDELRHQAANYYTAVATEHPVTKKFLAGWLRRAAS